MNSTRLSPRKHEKFRAAALGRDREQLRQLREETERFIKEKHGSMPKLDARTGKPVFTDRTAQAARTAGATDASSAEPDRGKGAEAHKRVLYAAKVA